MDYEHLDKSALIAILKRRDRQARFGLHWERDEITPDKALNNDFVGLELSAAHSVGAGPWKNLIIEGDNYDSLRSLATTHAGMFHLIYADVPYNTGRGDFVYNDRFFEATNRFRHSTWLEFIFQRMTLAKSLLREDGAIFVSIDDNELPHLWLLMNQVFGERSFVANCVWQKRYSRENRASIGDAHEYLLVFSPDPEKFKQRSGRLKLGEKQRAVYKNPNKHPRGPWRAVSLSAQGYRPNQMYEITSPTTGKIFTPPEGGCWKVIKSTFDELQAQGLIYFGKDGNAMPSRIQFLEDIEGMAPWTWWPHEEAGHTDEARKEIQALFGTQTAFDTPKPLRLMDRVLQIGAPEKDAFVLDFFAGSGTLGHAVLAQNAVDEGARRFVLMSNTEATEDNPNKNLCRDVCAVRIKKAIEGYEGRGASAPPLGGSFAYLAARRVAMHRLEEGLTDEMVWSFAQQACGHPVSAFQGPIALSTLEEHLVAYCANTKPTTLERLAKALQDHHGKIAVLTWAPKAIEDFLERLTGMEGRVSVVSVPGDLVRAFKQGNARIQSDSESATEVTESVQGALT